MNPVLDTVMLVLFVLFMIFIFSGYHNAKYHQREEEEKRTQANKEDSET